MHGGGFYPGDAAIEPAFNANLKPLLYLLEYSDNPRRVLSTGNKGPGVGIPVTPSAQGVAVADSRDAL
jgi:hypothetical protein